VSILICHNLTMLNTNSRIKTGLNPTRKQILFEVFLRNKGEKTSACKIIAFDTLTRGRVCAFSL